MPNQPAQRSEADDLVRWYLRDISRFRLLTREGEVRLAQAVEAGRAARAEQCAASDLSPARRRELCRLAQAGDAATQAFVTANLRLVVSIAKRYQAPDLALLDLIQEGNLGLLHAVEKFDWRKGFKFSTYATWWVRQAISRGIANGTHTVRLLVHAADRLHQVTTARARLEAQLGRCPSLPELAADLGLSADRIEEILSCAITSVSLTEPLRHDGDAELGDLVADPGAASPFEAAAASLLPGVVATMLAGLDDPEREILVLRFGLDRGEPRTLAEVGGHFDLPRERVRQIEARALAKLRHPTAGRDQHELLGS